MQRRQAEWEFRLSVYTLQAFHERNKLTIAPFHNAFLRRIACETIQRKQVVFHLILASYVADLPKIKEVLWNERGTRTTTLCQICDAKLHEFISYTVSSRRNWPSILPLLPVHYALHFIEINTILDTCAFLELGPCLFYLSVEVVCWESVFQNILMTKKQHQTQCGWKRLL